MTTSTTSTSTTEFSNLDDIQSVLNDWVKLEETKQQATKCWFDNLKKFYMVNSFESVSDCIDKALYHSGYATSETAKLKTDAPKKSSDRDSSHYDIEDGFKFINPDKALGKSGVEVMNSTIRSVSTGKKGKLEPKNITEFATYKELKDYYYSVQSKSSTKASDSSDSSGEDSASGKGSGKDSVRDSDKALTVEQAIAFIATSLPEIARVATLANAVRGTEGFEDLNRILKSIQIETPVYPDKPSAPTDITPEPIVLEELKEDEEVEAFELDRQHVDILAQCNNKYNIDILELLGADKIIELVELTIDDGYDLFAEMVVEELRELRVNI